MIALHLIAFIFKSNGIFFGLYWVYLRMNQTDDHTTNQVHYKLFVACSKMDLCAPIVLLLSLLLRTIESINEVKVLTSERIHTYMKLFMSFGDSFQFTFLADIRIHFLI